MIARRLIATLALWALLATPAFCQTIWMGGPSPLVFPHRARSAAGFSPGLRAPGAMMLSTPAFYLQPASAHGQARGTVQQRVQGVAGVSAACTCVGASSDGAVIYVGVSGKGTRDNDIAKAIEEAKKWPRDVKTAEQPLVDAITTAFKSEGSADEKKAFVDSVKAFIEKLKGDKLDTLRAMTTAWQVDSVNHAKFPETRKAIGQHLELMVSQEAGAKVAGTPLALDKQARERFVGYWTKILGALQSP